jgi:hypothetical protein
MTATLSPTTTTFRPAAAVRSAVATAPVWVVGAAASAVAAVATTLTVLAAKAVDVPLQAAPQTADGPEDLPVGAFPFSVVLSGVVGVLLAVALYRWAKRPGRTFVVATLVLTAVSFAGPITTGHATTATRVVLALTHVVAAAVVIPALAHRLTQRPARS